MSQEYLRKYGVQTILNFHLWEVDGVDLRVDAADGGTDCTLRKDQGADTTCVNDFVDEGLTYSIIVTATEMEFAEGLLHVIDTDGPVYLDEVLKIETYGHASAQHALDLDDADGSTLTETGGDGAQLTEAGGDGDHLVEVQVADGSMIAASFAADALVAATFATDAIAADALAADAAAQIVDAWETQSQADPTGFHVNVKEVDGTGQTGNDNGADINAILAMLDDARGEPGQGAPPVNPDMATKIDYIYKWLRNKTETTVSEHRIYADDASTVDQKAAVSSDGTTYTKGEIGTGA